MEKMSETDKQAERFNILLDTFYADSFSLEEAIDAVNCRKGRKIAVKGGGTYDYKYGQYIDRKHYERNVTEVNVISKQRLDNMVLRGWLIFDGNQYSATTLDYKE